MNLKEKCQMTDQEWEERQKTRQLEIEAVSKALAILSSDDAHDLFSKTFNPALLEKQNSQHQKARQAASKLLSDVAQKNEHEKKNLIQKIEDLTMEIDELAKAIETLKAEIAEMQVQMKRAVSKKKAKLGSKATEAQA